MPDTQLIKALLIHAAATNAATVCEGAVPQAPIPVDPLIKDTNLQAKGLMVYEEAKIQYAALVRAFQDETGVWPTPTVKGGTTSVNLTNPTLSSIIGEAGPLLSTALPALAGVPQLAPLAGLLSTLLGKKPASTAPAPAKPSATTPGADIPTTPANPASPTPSTQGANS